MIKTPSYISISSRIVRNRYLSILLLLGVFVLVAVAAYFARTGNFLGYDWRIYFRPALLEFLAGRSPYTVEGFFNPPWILILLSPLALLSEKASAAFMFSFIWLVFGAVAVLRLKAKPVALIALMFSPVVIECALYGGMDWVIPLGLVMPPWLGLFFIMAKPQIGLGIAIFWLVEAWQIGGAKAVLRRFVPVSAAYLISFLVYGPYLFGWKSVFTAEWNVSMWPVAICVAIPLMLVSLRERRIDLAVSASPFFSPYVNLYSWSVGLLGMVSSPLAITLSSVALWVTLALLV